jgi:hypothetical protein
MGSCLSFLRHLPTHLMSGISHDCFEDLFEQSEFRRSNQTCETNANLVSTAHEQKIRQEFMQGRNFISTCKGRLILKIHKHNLDPVRNNGRGSES